MIDRKKQKELALRAKKESYGLNRLVWPSATHGTYDPEDKLRKAHQKTAEERRARRDKN